MNQRSRPRRPIVRKAIACGVIPLVVLTTAGKCSGLVACARVVGIVGRTVEDHKTKRPEPVAPARPAMPNP
jgi:hypothetical protein